MFTPGRTRMLLPSAPHWSHAGAGKVVPNARVDAGPGRGWQASPGTAAALVLTSLPTPSIPGSRWALCWMRNHISTGCAGAEPGHWQGMRWWGRCFICLKPASVPLLLGLVGTHPPRYFWNQPFPVLLSPFPPFSSPVLLHGCAGLCLGPVWSPAAALGLLFAAFNENPAEAISVFLNR